MPNTSKERAMRRERNRRYRHRHRYRSRYTNYRSTFNTFVEYYATLADLIKGEKRIRQRITQKRKDLKHEQNLTGTE